MNTTVNCTSTCTTTTTNGSQGLIVGNNAAFGNGPIQTYDLATGALVNSFVPDGATASANGRGVAVVGNEIFYTELSNSPSFGPSDGIHVAPFNNGAGGSDLRVLPNPAPTFGNSRPHVRRWGALRTHRVWHLWPASSMEAGRDHRRSDWWAYHNRIRSRRRRLRDPSERQLPHQCRGRVMQLHRIQLCYGSSNREFVYGPNASTCTGVETDRSSLYFETDFNSFDRRLTSRGIPPQRRASHRTK